MKTIKALCAVVMTCGFAGIVGCISRSQGEPFLESQQAADTGAMAPVASSVPSFTDPPTTAEETSESIKPMPVRAENPRVARFAELDTDGDGQLSMAEFGAGRKPKDAQKWFGRRDADRDGSISLMEFVPKSASTRNGMKDDEMEGEAQLPTVNSIDE